MCLILKLAWKIPPCISNWKNTKGYTIPLDKRLAADGRGLQEVTINDNFAKFAESLYIAEAASREEVAKRAAIQRKLAVNEKEQVSGFIIINVLFFLERRKKRLLF